MKNPSIERCAPSDEDLGLRSFEDPGVRVEVAERGARAGAAGGVEAASVHDGPEIELPARVVPSRDGAVPRQVGRQLPGAPVRGGVDVRQLGPPRDEHHGAAEHLGCAYSSVSCIIETDYDKTGESP